MYSTYPASQRTTTPPPNASHEASSRGSTKAGGVVDATTTATSLANSASVAAAAVASDARKMREELRQLQMEHVQAGGTLDDDTSRFGFVKRVRGAAVNNTNSMASTSAMLMRNNANNNNGGHVDSSMATSKGALNDSGSRSAGGGGMGFNFSQSNGAAGGAGGSLSARGRRDLNLDTSPMIPIGPPGGDRMLLSSSPAPASTSGPLFSLTTPHSSTLHPSMHNNNIINNTSSISNITAAQQSAAAAAGAQGIKTFVFSEQMEEQRRKMLVEARALRNAHAGNKKPAYIKKQMSGSNAMMGLGMGGGGGGSSSLSPFEPDAGMFSGAKRDSAVFIDYYDDGDRMARRGNNNCNNNRPSSLVGSTDRRRHESIFEAFLDNTANSDTGEFILNTTYNRNAFGGGEGGGGGNDALFLASTTFNNTYTTMKPLSKGDDGTTLRSIQRREALEEAASSLGRGRESIVNAVPAKEPPSLSSSYTPRQLLVPKSGGGGGGGNSSAAHFLAPATRNKKPAMTDKPLLTAQQQRIENASHLLHRILAPIDGKGGLEGFANATNTAQQQHQGTSTSNHQSSSAAATAFESVKAELNQILLEEGLPLYQRPDRKGGSQKATSSSASPPRYNPYNDPSFDLSKLDVPQMDDADDTAEGGGKERMAALEWKQRGEEEAINAREEEEGEEAEGSTKDPAELAAMATNPPSPQKDTTTAASSSAANNPSVESPLSHFPSSPTNTITRKDSFLVAFEKKIETKLRALELKEAAQSGQARTLHSGTVSNEECIQPDGIVLKNTAQLNDKYRLVLLRKQLEREEKERLAREEKEAEALRAKEEKANRREARRLARAREVEVAGNSNGDPDTLVRLIEGGAARDGGNGDDNNDDDDDDDSSVSSQFTSAHSLADDAADGDGDDEHNTHKHHHHNNNARATAHINLVMRHVRTSVKATKSYVSNFRQRLLDIDAEGESQKMINEAFEKAFARLDKNNSENNNANATTTDKEGIVTKSSEEKILTYEELEAMEEEDRRLAAEEAAAARRRREEEEAKEGGNNAHRRHRHLQQPSSSHFFPSTMPLADCQRILIVQSLVRKRRAARCYYQIRTAVAQHNADRAMEEERALRDVPIPTGDAGEEEKEEGLDDHQQTQHDAEMEAIDEEIMNLEQELKLQSLQMDYLSLMAEQQLREEAVTCVQRWFRSISNQRKLNAALIIQRAGRTLRRRREMFGTFAERQFALAARVVERACHRAAEKAASANAAAAEVTSSAIRRASMVTNASSAAE